MAILLCLLSLAVGAVGILSLLSSPDFGLELEYRDDAWLISNVESGGPAAAAGVAPGSTVSSLGGAKLGRYSLIHDFDMIPDFSDLVAFWDLQRDLGSRLLPGIPAAFELGEDGGGRRVMIVPVALSFAKVLGRTAPLYIPALYCLAVGLAVALKRRKDDRARLFFVMLFTVSLIFFTFGSWSSRNLVARPSLMYNLAVFNLAYAFPFFPVVFFHFCLAFPVKARILDRKLFLILLYALPVLVLAVYIPRLVFEAYQLYWAGGLVGGAVVMLVRYFRQRVPLYRAQIKWILWGTVAFGIGMFLTYSIPLLVRSYGYYSYLLPSFSFLLIPTTFALAILRYRLLDIDNLFDSTFAHTIAAAFFLGIDILLSFGAARLMGNDFIPNEALASAMTIILVIVFYVPLRERLNILIKRLFKREYYKADKVALELASGLLSALDEASAVGAFSATLNSTLHPRWRLSLGAPMPAGVVDSAVPGLDLDPADRNLAASLAEKLDVPRDFDSLLAPAEAPPKLSGAVVAPLRAHGRSLAAIVLGPKASGNLYSSGDLRLIEALSGQTALALDDLAERRKALQAEIERQEEHKRLSGEIHDGVGGMLSNSIMLSELVLGEELEPHVRTRVSAIQNLLRQCLTELRTMIWALHDAEGTAISLADAMEERMRQMTAGQPIAFSFTRALERGAVLSASLRLHLLRAGQELVANGVRHAAPNSIRLVLRLEGTELCLEYEDDGRGCDLAAAKRGYGLSNLEKRAQAMGGTLRLVSALGEGFKATMRVPARAVSPA